jgi:hypothetical protein
VTGAASAAGPRPAGAARVLVLGGGFGGVHTAVHLERLAARGAPLEISLVNRENYLVFQPMLAEVIAGDVGILDTRNGSVMRYSAMASRSRVAGDRRGHARLGRQAEHRKVGRVAGPVFGL